MLLVSAIYSLAIVFLSLDLTVGTGIASLGRRVSSTRSLSCQLNGQVDGQSRGRIHAVRLALSSRLHRRTRAVTPSSQIRRLLRRTQPSRIRAQEIYPARTRLNPTTATAPRRRVNQRTPKTIRVTISTHTRLRTRVSPWRNNRVRPSPCPMMCPKCTPCPAT